MVAWNTGGSLGTTELVGRGFQRNWRSTEHKHFLMVIGGWFWPEPVVQLFQRIMTASDPLQTLAICLDQAAGASDGTESAN